MYKETKKIVDDKKSTWKDKNSEKNKLSIQKTEHSIVHDVGRRKEWSGTLSTSTKICWILNSYRNLSNFGNL